MVPTADNAITLIDMITNACKPLKPKWKDKRFMHAKKFGLISLSAIPMNGMGRVPYKIDQQFDTLYCTGAGTSSAAEYEQRRKFSFEFQVAAISRRTGAPIYDGADPRKALEARVAYGCLPDEMTPDNMRLSEINQRAVALWRNWRQDLWDAARAYVAGGFFWLGEEYEPYDQVKEALWNARNENQVVMAFGKWFDAWSGVGPDGIVPATTQGHWTMHNYDLIDWTMISGVEYIVVQNSCGTGFGKGGLQYIDRSTFNAAWPRAYGDGTDLAIWRKVDPNDVNSLKAEYISLLELLASIYDSMLFKIRYGFSA